MSNSSKNGDSEVTPRILAPLQTNVRDMSIFNIVYLLQCSHGRGLHLQAQPPGCPGCSSVLLSLAILVGCQDLSQLRELSQAVSQDLFRILLDELHGRNVIPFDGKFAVKRVCQTFSLGEVLLWTEISVRYQLNPFPITGLLARFKRMQTVSFQLCRRNYLPSFSRNRLIDLCRDCIRGPRLLTLQLGLTWFSLPPGWKPPSCRMRSFLGDTPGLLEQLFQAPPPPRDSVGRLDLRRSRRKSRDHPFSPRASLMAAAYSRQKPSGYSLSSPVAKDAILPFTTTGFQPRLPFRGP